MGMVLGLRATDEGFAYTVLDGAREAPVTVVAATFVIPKTLVGGKRLAEVRRETLDLTRRFQLTGAALKATEAQTVTSSTIARCQLEGVIIEACASSESGPIEVVSKRWLSIKSSLKLGRTGAGEAKNIADMFGLKANNQDQREAAIVALCIL